MHKVNIQNLNTQTLPKLSSAEAEELLKAINNLQFVRTDVACCDLITKSALTFNLCYDGTR